MQSYHNHSILNHNKSIALHILSFRSVGKLDQVLELGFPDHNLPVSRVCPFFL